MFQTGKTEFIGIDNKSPSAYLTSPLVYTDKFLDEWKIRSSNATSLFMFNQQFYPLKNAAITNSYFDVHGIVFKTCSQCPVEVQQRTQVYNLYFQVDKLHPNGSYVFAGRDAVMYVDVSIQKWHE